MLKAKPIHQTVNNTVLATSTLLNTWTRILSQTEHNQRLILDPMWHGASQDITDIEEEAVSKQRAIERREAEEEERRRAAMKMAEDEERKQAELANKPSKLTARGMARSASAGRGLVANTSSTSYVQVGGPGAGGTRRGTSVTRRPTSGIGRGIGARGGRTRT
jgi:hypothetical protein